MVSKLLCAVSNDLQQLWCYFDHVSLMKEDYFSVALLTSIQNEHAASLLVNFLEMPCSHWRVYICTKIDCHVTLVLPGAFGATIALLRILVNIVFWLVMNLFNSCFFFSFPFLKNNSNIYISLQKRNSMNAEIRTIYKNKNICILFYCKCFRAKPMPDCP